MTVITTDSQAENNLLYNDQILHQAMHYVYIWILSTNHYIKNEDQIHLLAYLFSPIYDTVVIQIHLDNFVSFKERHQFLYINFHQ